MRQPTGRSTRNSIQVLKRIASLTLDARYKLHDVTLTDSDGAVLLHLPAVLAANAILQRFLAHVLLETTFGSFALGDDSSPTKHSDSLASAPPVPQVSSASSPFAITSFPSSIKKQATDLARMGSTFCKSSEVGRYGAIICNRIFDSIL
jgi:hypothetical protein